MALEAVGMVEFAEWKPGKRGTFLVIKFRADGSTDQYPWNMAFFGNSKKSDLSTTVGKKIKVVYTEQQNGQYTNRAIQSFSLAGAASPSAPAPVAQAATSLVAQQQQTPDARQENINRQSAYHQAVQVASSLIEAGYKIAPGSDKKAKEANKDPEAVLSLIAYIARKIKLDVQTGDWDVGVNAADVPEPEALADVPF